MIYLDQNGILKMEGLSGMDQLQVLNLSTTVIIQAATRFRRSMTILTWLVWLNSISGTTAFKISSWRTLRNTCPASRNSISVHLFSFRLQPPLEQRAQQSNHSKTNKTSDHIQIYPEFLGRDAETGRYCQGKGQFRRQDPQS